MKMVCVLFLLFFCHGFCFKVWGKKNSSRPDCIKIGAIFNLNSTIGRVAKIAIDAAISDINSNFGVLGGPKLIVRTMDTNFSGFLSIIEALQFMESDVIAIIGPQSSETAHMISHISNELMVPLLSFSATDPSLTSLEYPFFVRMTQSDLFQMAAIAEIIDYYQWRQVIAVYIDDDYGRNGIAVLGDKLQERRCKISYKAKLPPGASQSAIFDVLFKVSLMESRVIILHMNADSGLLVLSVANSLSMMTSGYVWITTDWLSAVFDSTPLPPETMDRIQGVIALRQYTEDSKKKRVFISRWGKLASKQGFNSLGLNSYGFYAYDSVWTVAYAINGFFNDGGTITFSNNSKIKDADKGSLHLEALTMFNGGSLLLRKILETKFEGISGQVQFDSDKSLVHPAYEILNVVGTGYHRIGFWSNYSGLSTEPPDILYMKPPNRSSSSQKLSSVIWPGDVITLPRGWVFPQNGKQLKIGVPDRVSYREFISKVKGTDIVKGYCIDVFLAAVNLLPYAFQFEFIPFGNGRENPNFNELVNLVASNVFDAAIGDIAIVTNRTKIVDFTQPYIESGLVIVAPTKRLSSNAWAFLRPFTVEMWCVTGAFFIVVGVVVWILEHRINDDFRGSPRQQIVTILWFIFSTLFFAHRENTASTLARFVLIIWLFVVLIINSSYTASLTSILTVQQLSSPVKGIESLISGNDPIGFQVGSFAENYMVQELHIDHSRLKSLGTPEEYADALKRGPQNGGVTAIVDELPYVELFLSKECKFSIIGQEFTKSGWGFAFPRDSPLAIDMSTAILSLSENGDLQRIHDKWLTRSGCPTQSSEVIEANRLHLSSFWGLFMICGVSCFIAILIYLILLCRQFNRHVSQQPRSPNLSSYRTFLSFANEKKAEKSENSSTSKKTQIQEPSNNNASTL